MEEKRLLVISAHPILPDLAVGGTIAVHVRNGWGVYVACLTLADKTFTKVEDQETLAQQQKAASEIEGVTEVRFLGFEDAQIRNDRKTRTTILDVIRELKPDVVLTHWYNTTHPDQRETALAVCDACLISSLPVKSSYPQHLVRTVFMFPTPGFSFNFEPEVYIDISDVIDIKRKAIEQHKLYLSIVPKEIILEAYLGNACYNGMAAGVRYAETFKQYWSQHYGRRAVNTLL